MTQLVLKNDIHPFQLNVLLQLLKSWNIKAETLPTAANTVAEVPASTVSEKPYTLFSESFGMWKDRDIDAKELRRQASGYDRRTRNQEPGTRNYDTL
jgi:hypothetical protein